MNPNLLAIFKYGIIVVLALSGAILIFSQKPAVETAPYLIGVALLASAIFSIADVARDYLSIQQELAGLPAALRKHPELRDPEFWLEAFNKMPPMFIKKIEPGSQSSHMIDNPKLHEFQGPPPISAQTEPTIATIKNDHLHGDEQAAKIGISIQLEMCEPGEGRVAQPILTIKRRFQHRGSYYLVGTYVAVRPELVLNATTLQVVEDGGQIVFGLRRSSGAGLPVRVGESLRASFGKTSAP